MPGIALSVNVTLGGFMLHVYCCSIMFQFLSLLRCRNVFLHKQFKKFFLHLSATKNPAMCAGLSMCQLVLDATLATYAKCPTKHHPHWEVVISWCDMYIFLKHTVKCFIIFRHTNM